MKSVLLNTTVIGSSVKLPRHPKLIIGEADEYNYGDILDANAVKKEIKDAVNRAVAEGSDVEQVIQELDQRLNDMIESKVAELIGAAPETLDTLKEIADALNNDPAFASTVFDKINEIKQVNENQDATIQQLIDAQEETTSVYEWNNVA